MPASSSTRPVPQPDQDSHDFWDGLRRHEIVLKRCNGCGRFVHFPAPVCRHCQSADIGNARVSGRGKVHSFIVTHHVVTPGFEGDAPYVVALVELGDERGLRLVTNITGCKPADVRVGMPVEPVFEDVTPEVTLLKFRPADA